MNHCQAILKLSCDGDELSAKDLHLVENAANDHLTPRGEIVLYQLRYKLENNLYHTEHDWFCGVENLTRGKGDDRSVFWRGIKVEHFDHDFWKSTGWQNSMRKDAQHLGAVCRYLDEHSIVISFENYCRNSKRATL